MAPLSCLRSPRSRPSLCARCAFRAAYRPSKVARRWMGTNYMATAAAADMEGEWAARAKEIKAGNKKSMYKKLEERGYIHAVTGRPDQAEQWMTEKRLGAYVGIDPTASSLHVGHMLPLMALFWMHIHGYHTVTLVGGATAKIGDPSDRLTTRKATNSSVRAHNTASMQSQLKHLWVNVEAYGNRYGYTPEPAWKGALLNNSMWWNETTLIEVLQVLGPGMRMGTMLARDTVKNKMKKGDGMSFAEFTYPILQAWDWWTLYRTSKIQMQIGGSDQFGNITAGIDAVKYISASHHDNLTRKEVAPHGPPFGFTVPLLTTSSGQKFGKSAGNAIWLDKNQTSSFELYKFFLGTSDADVAKYLKLFTFIPLEQIYILVEEHMRSPHQRKAQHKLARDFVELVHGEEEAENAELQHRLLFSRKTIPPEEHLAAQFDASLPPSPIDLPPAAVIDQTGQPRADLKLPRSAVESLSIGKLLLACGLVGSSTEGHRLVAQNAVYVGRRNDSPGLEKPMDENSLIFTQCKTWKMDDAEEFLIGNKLLIFRRGKTFIRIVEVVSDSEYTEMGLTYPGMKKPSDLAQAAEEVPETGS
ncbi:Tyrosyl-tRNA synthetase [Hyphodiscus hymeniophilus]|uniref:Tyrosine--tRNA ligase n=1 Tax=Hyphodiscus hymeniophilus TaxID=353542 RepID=A0A9P6VCH0_9HELO|nr:Tyrosyl-tRNA synthetase [Hyphodiscus hymeniophilus]